MQIDISFGPCNNHIFGADGLGGILHEQNNIKKKETLRYYMKKHSHSIPSNPPSFDQGPWAASGCPFWLHYNYTPMGIGMSRLAWKSSE